MSLKTQAKVLRALDEQSFTPLGGREALQVDVRVIATTNKNLEEEIAHGNFREDLFYRLNVIPFFVPPLRERREDIPPLVRVFLELLGREYGRSHVEITADALELMKGYTWPGNVRELKNILERTLILNPQLRRIERRHLPALIQRTTTRSGPAGEDFASLQMAREAYERDFILKKIDECHGNMSRAAEVLGLERSHLYRKMRTLGIAVRENS
jgi:two-component system nitrogen regulation response regulator NtrX